MILHQLFDKTSSTYTYLLGDAKTGQALVIDSVLENNSHDIAASTGLRAASIVGY